MNYTYTIQRQFNGSFQPFIFFEFYLFYTRFCVIIIRISITYKTFKTGCEKRK
uniref:Candidate secreted effector n=1 Tax=Meloidogyne incognita TaxID=6306 RepID=A0A914L8D1_MELIC